MGLIRETIQYPVLITYMTGANNYTWLNFRDGRRQLVSKSLSYFERHLPGFLRVHKTALVNPQYVRDWQEPPRRRMAGTIRMQGNIELPVGRRRWDDVVQQLLAAEENQQPVAVAESEYRSIIFQTNEQTKALLFQETLEKQCPDCLVHTVKPKVPLPELIRILPDNELPVLILLDASTDPGERLSTLQRLKVEPRTAFIPTLLLVTENANDIIEKAYARKANSVVPIAYPEKGSQHAAGQHTLFVQKVTQLARYWLSVTALPLPRPSTLVSV
ncbi:LytTR family transcriptional regulator DNA-binding domain-containing protein [Spirosoma soli]|uniref:LytTR family transcriptional regulator DNA-binding domain-containing protein n=1 Tax=Spirosoma soli TaxID=1770529 RepID=A0ABW5M0F8_9BACT